MVHRTAAKPFPPDPASQSTLVPRSGSQNLVLETLFLEPCQTRLPKHRPPKPHPSLRYEVPIQLLLVKEKRGTGDGDLWVPDKATYWHPSLWAEKLLDFYVSVSLAEVLSSCCPESSSNEESTNTLDLSNPQLPHICFGTFIPSR